MAAEIPTGKVLEQIAATGFRSSIIPKTTLSKTFSENSYRQFRPRRLQKYENSRLASYEFHNDGLAKCFTKNDKKNCFAIGGFLTPVDVNPIENAESDHFVPPENWSNLSDVTAFEEFVQCDSELATCSLLTIDEMISNEETSSEEEDNCTEKPLPSFQQALAGFNITKEYLIISDLNDKVKMTLFSVHSKKALQPKITKCIL
ncbi:hypothetical protein AVEN_199685-1 [Araneus ventricosus]|uniref:Uncharacterized protein n=1 Tax=Araneus ventricosus TaxID=182803 RepID=A0A4Y2DHD5_ARAVE|nr:hypothetical protein AVEN_199685-1 [Araneus ventricosus]